MLQKNLPVNLRNKVRRYLDYVMESKTEMKVDESEIFELLNENLSNKVQMYLNGRNMGQITFMN